MLERVHVLMGQEGGNVAESLIHIMLMSPACGDG